MRERHPDEIAEDPNEVEGLPLEIEGLPPEIEADFIEAMSPDVAPSEALRAHLRAHPRDAELLDHYRELAARVEDSAEALDPGPHFFEALFDDVMGQLPPQGADPSRVEEGASPARYADAEAIGLAEARGRALGGRRGQPEAATAGWLESLLAIFKARPAMAWGAVMLAALLALALWPSQEAPRPAPQEAEVAGVEDQKQTVGLETDLSAQELGELRQLASQMVLDMNDDLDEAEEPEEGSWRTEPVEALQALDEDELAALDAALAKL